MPRNAPEQYWLPGMEDYENAPWWSWDAISEEWKCLGRQKVFNNDRHLDNPEHTRRTYNWCTMYKHCPEVGPHWRRVRKNPDFKWDPTPPSDEERIKGKGKGMGQGHNGPPGTGLDLNAV